MEAPNLEIDEPTPDLTIVHKPADLAPLYAKIAAVMGEVQRVEKGKEVKFEKGGGYKVATIDDLLDMLRPIMAKHKIVCIPTMVSMERDGDVAGWHNMTGQFLFTVADAETGVSFQEPWEATTRSAGDKTTQKVARTALRYFLTCLFGLSTGDTEDDGDLTPPEPTQQDFSSTGNGKPPRKVDTTKEPKNRAKFDYTFASGFDYSAFWPVINNMFDNNQHAVNTLNKMFKDGELLPEMDHETAIQSVEDNRQRRLLEKTEGKIQKPTAKSEADDE